MLTLLIPFAALLMFANVSRAEYQQEELSLKSDTITPAFEIIDTPKQSIPPSKQWESVLPFFAQDVIMNGYDLPLPFGISLIYAKVQQDMRLTDLSLGFNGSEKVDIEFISFDTITSNTSTPHLKLDAWILPFMNVFATVGKLSGSVDINFAIDGNKALDQLGSDCSKKIKPLECYLLTDKRIEIEEQSSLAGTSYSVGTVFVGGWNSYFIAVPITFSWSKMDRDTSGYVINVLPRVGKKFQLNNGSSLALYAGTSYLTSRLTLTGTQPIDDSGESFEYQIKQENTNKWMGLIGGNYSIKEGWSLAFEYGGIGGISRQQFITNLTYRY